MEMDQSFFFLNAAAENPASASRVIGTAAPGTPVFGLSVFAAVVVFFVVVDAALVVDVVLEAVVAAVVVVTAA